MTRIDTTIDVGEDRQLVLQLPEEVRPGEHRVTILIDQPEPTAGEGGEQSLVRKGSVLVYTGKPVGPIENIVDEVRRELREKHRFVFGPSE